MIKFREAKDSIIFAVRVVPRASKSEIVGEFGGALKIRIAAPPVNGTVNAELVKLLSKSFNLSKSDVKILSGTAAKIKQVKFSNLSRENFSRFFETRFSRKQ